MTEPTTEAGRWLSGMKLLGGNRAAFVADILAIEAEARAEGAAVGRETLYYDKGRADGYAEGYRDARAGRKRAEAEE